MITSPAFLLTCNSGHVFFVCFSRWASYQAVLIISPKSQILNSHFPEVDDLLDEHQVKCARRNLWLCSSIKQRMTVKGLNFVFKNSGVSYQTSIFNLRSI